MHTHIGSLPFTVENPHHGLTQVEGLLRLEQGNLVLEYRTTDSVFGILKTELKEVWVPLGELETVLYRSRFFGFYRRVVIKARRQSAFGEFPEAAHGALELHVRWNDREAAETFCMEMKQLVLRLKNEQLSNELDRELGRHMDRELNQ